MTARSLQLVLQYHGGEFSGWQLQPGERTVQGVLEATLERLTQQKIRVRGAGRTDAGVHALAQCADVTVAGRWTAAELLRALNATLPPDVRVTGVFRMRDGFDARRAAVARRYSYWIGTGAEAESPFVHDTEWLVPFPLDRDALDDCAAQIAGERSFRSFAVKGTAPETDDHRCRVSTARWLDRPGGVVFVIEANRFLHHMVRFLVGTMVELASARRPGVGWAEIANAEDNSRAGPPAPAHALFLERVCYPAEMYAA